MYVFKSWKASRACLQDVKRMVANDEVEMVCKFVSTHPDVINQRSAKNKNNIFHIIAKAGSRTMLTAFLGIISTLAHNQPNLPLSPVSSFTNKEQRPEHLDFILRFMNTRNKAGETPLLIAAARGHKGIVLELLNQGADWTLADHVNKNKCLHTAIRNEHTHVVKVILEWAKGQFYEPTLASSQTLSAAGAAVTRLTQLAASIDWHQTLVATLDNLGSVSPLGVYRLPRQLQTRSMQSNPDDHRPTISSRRGDSSSVQTTSVLHRLLRDRNWEGHTPLHAAATRALQDVVGILCKYGADMNAVTTNSSMWCFIPCDHGCTPLHLATERGHVQVVKVILRHYLCQQMSGRGPAQDPRSVTDGKGLRAYQLAEFSGRRCLAEVFKPCYPLRALFPEVCRPRSVPKLSVIAAAALKSHLLVQLQDHSDEMDTTNNSNNAKSSSRSTGHCMQPSSTVNGMPMQSDSGEIQYNALSTQKRQQHGDNARCESSDLCTQQNSSRDFSSASTLASSGLLGSGSNHEIQVVITNTNGMKTNSSNRDSEIMYVRDGDASARARVVPMASTQPLVVVQLDSEEDQEDALTTCDVCFDASATISIQPCSHRLCAGCTRRIVFKMKNKPAACPFCRRSISGLQRY